MELHRYWANWTSECWKIHLVLLFLKQTKNETGTWINESLWYSVWGCDEYLVCSGHIAGRNDHALQQRGSSSVVSLLLHFLVGCNINLLKGLVNIGGRGILWREERIVLGYVHINMVLFQNVILILLPKFQGQKQDGNILSPYNFAAPHNIEKALCHRGYQTEKLFSSYFLPFSLQTRLTVFNSTC